MPENNQAFAPVEGSPAHTRSYGHLSMALDFPQLRPAIRSEARLGCLGSDGIPAAIGHFRHLKVEQMSVGGGEKVAEIEMPVTVLLLAWIGGHPMGVDIDR